MNWSRSVVSDSLQPHGLYPIRLLHPWDFPGKSTGEGCHFLLQGIFPTQGSNPGLPHCGQMLYPLSHQGSFLPLIASKFWLMVRETFTFYCYFVILLLWFQFLNLYFFIHLEFILISWGYIQLTFISDAHLFIYFHLLDSLIFLSQIWNFTFLNSKLTCEFWPVDFQLSHCLIACLFVCDIF